jgi:hypothetical protein
MSSSGYEMPPVHVQELIGFNKSKPDIPSPADMEPDMASYGTHAANLQPATIPGPTMHYAASPYLGYFPAGSMRIAPIDPELIDPQLRGPTSAVAGEIGGDPSQVPEPVSRSTYQSVNPDLLGNSSNQVPTDGSHEIPSLGDIQDPAPQPAGYPQLELQQYVNELEEMLSDQWNPNIEPGDDSEDIDDMIGRYLPGHKNKMLAGGNITSELSRNSQEAEINQSLSGPQRTVPDQGGPTPGFDVYPQEFDVNRLGNDTQAMAQGQRNPTLQFADFSQEQGVNTFWNDAQGTVLSQGISSPWFTNNDGDIGGNPSDMPGPAPAPTNQEFQGAIPDQVGDTYNHAPNPLYDDDLENWSQGVIPDQGDIYHNAPNPLYNGDCQVGSQGYDQIPASQVEAESASIGDTDSGGSYQITGSANDLLDEVVDPDSDDLDNVQPSNGIGQEQQVIDNQDGRAEDDSDIKLQYSDHDAMYSAEFTKVLFNSPSPDATIPTTPEEQQEIVKRLIKAIRNTDGVRDIPHKPSFIHRWGKKSKYFSVGDFEKLGWLILRWVVQIHLDGWKYPIWDEKLRKAIQKTAGMTFKERIDAIINLLHHNKRTCEDLLKGEKLFTVIGIPLGLQSRVKQNKTQNGNRSDYIKVGRDVVKEKAKKKAAGNEKADKVQVAQNHTLGEHQASQRAVPQVLPQQLGVPPQPRNAAAPSITAAPAQSYMHMASPTVPSNTAPNISYIPQQPAASPHTAAVPTVTSTPFHMAPPAVPSNVVFNNSYFPQPPAASPQPTAIPTVTATPLQNHVFQAPATPLTMTTQHAILTGHPSGWAGRMTPPSIHPIPVSPYPSPTNYKKRYREQVDNGDGDNADSAGVSAGGAAPAGTERRTKRARTDNGHGNGSTATQAPPGPSRPTRVRGRHVQKTKTPKVKGKNAKK